MSQEPQYRRDRPYTYLVTFISLGIGVAAAAIVALALLALRQPLIAMASGAPVSVGSFMIPLAGLLSVVILVWSVFFLPVRFANRRGIVLDPEVWPATGAVAVGVLVIVLFASAILFGLL